MKQTFSVAILFILLFSMLHTNAQEYKTLKEINNAFIDRKDEWVAAKKDDLGLMPMPKGVAVNFSGSLLTVNNGKNLQSLVFDNPTTKKYEQECWNYANGRFTVGINQLSGDPQEYSGFSIKRRLDISTIRANWGKTIDGKMDYQDRRFSFLLNGKGDVKVLAARKTSEVLFTAEASKDFKPGAVNILSVEKKTLTWNFYLNNNLVFTYQDNSYGPLSNIDFTVGAGSKISYEALNYVYYDNRFAPYARETEGSTVYIDNECKFKVLEGKIDLLCHTAELNSRTIRYFSIYCDKQKEDFRFAILFFKKGEQEKNPIADFLENYLKDLYGAEYDAEVFKNKKALAEKDNEVKLVEEIKNSFISQNKTVTNVKFSDVNNMTIGNMNGRFLDVNFEMNGTQLVERKFFSYLPLGLMIIQFNAAAGKLDTNQQYTQVTTSVHSFM